MLYLQFLNMSQQNSWNYSILIINKYFTFVIGINFTIEKCIKHNLLFKANNVIVII